MIFKEDIKDVIGKSVWFVVAGCGKRKILTGICHGMFGSGASIFVDVGGETYYPGLKDVYKEGAVIPDEECAGQYRIGMYESKINSLWDLVDFALEYPVTVDEEARAAYKNSARRLIGYEKEV